MAQAAVALVALAYQAYVGETQRAAASKGRRLAQEAAREGEAAALAEAKRGEIEENRARALQPDLSVLLDDSNRRRQKAADAINVDRLMLGRPGALGLGRIA